MTLTRDESGFRHRLRVPLDPPYTQESVSQAKRQQELERERAAIEAAIPASKLYMVQGD